MSADFGRWRQSPAAHLCTCSHTREQHDHYHDRTYCGTCGPKVCGSFHRQVTEQTRQRPRVLLIAALFVLSCWALAAYLTR